MKKYIKLYNKYGQLLGFQQNTQDDGQKISIVSITPAMPATNYNDIVITLSESVTIYDVLDHLSVKFDGYSGRQIIEPGPGESPSIGLMQGASSSTYSVKLVDNVITISDLSSQHAPLITSVTWLQ